MTSLLKNNIVATGLLGLAGITLLLALLMQLTASIDLKNADQADAPALDDYLNEDLAFPGDFEEYAVVDERPLFNTTRRPIAVEDAASGEESNEPEEVQPLNAALAGVVIVDDEMIVLLQDNDTKEFVRTRVGVGMEGPFADWRVEEIGPRSVKLTSFEGESMQLDMEVAELPTAGPAGTAQPGSAPAAEKNAAQSYEQAINNPGQSGDNESRAEEIRRRIAERRAQLQAAADQKAAQKNGKNDDDI